MTRNALARKSPQWTPILRWRSSGYAKAEADGRTWKVNNELVESDGRWVFDPRVVTVQYRSARASVQISTAPRPTPAGIAGQSMLARTSITERLGAGVDRG